jgi:hypothetical protein
MKEPVSYRKAGLKELCNFQSKFPFIAFESMIADTPIMSSISIEGGNSQIYCGTRHFLRKTAHDEPFYSGKITDSLSAMHAFDETKIRNEMESAEEKIESLKDSPGCLRLEQNMNYTIDQTASNIDFRRFFSEHISAVINVQLVSRKRYGLNSYSNLRERASKSSLLSLEVCKLLDYYEEIGLGDLELWALCNVPLYQLGITTVPYRIWPGILKGYMQVFKCILDKAISTVKDYNFLPTEYLEVICIYERTMQYLFSGNPKKLGKGTDFEAVIWLNIKEKSFPLMSSRFFQYSTNGWKILVENYPLNFWCFSSFLTNSKPRKLFYNLEKTFGGSYAEFCDALCNSFVLSVFDEVNAVMTMDLSVSDLFDERVYKSLMKKSVLRSSARISLDLWILSVIHFLTDTLLKNVTKIKKIRPISLRQICLFLHFKEFKKLSRLQKFLSKYFETVNPFWLPVIDDNGYQIDTVCIVDTSHGAIQEIFDVSDRNLDFYDRVFLPSILKKFQFGSLYQNYRIQISKYNSCFDSFWIQSSIPFRMFFFKMLFYAMYLVKKPNSKIDKLFEQYANKLAPLILLFEIISKKANEIDLFRKLKKGSFAPFKDYISIGTLSQLNLCSNNKSWVTLEISGKLSSEWTQFKRLLNAKNIYEAYDFICLEAYRDKKEYISRVQSIIRYLRDEK